MDPTNVLYGWVFGVLKYVENSLLNLQFGLLVQHTMAQFNKVSALLSSIDTANLKNSEMPDIEKKMKQEHLHKQENFLNATRRFRDEILSQTFLTS